MFPTKRIALLVLFSATACNSPGSVSTTFMNGELQVKDAVFIPMTDQGHIIGGMMWLGDQPDMCRNLNAGRFPKKLEALQFEFASFSDSTVLAPDVGDYSVLVGSPTHAGNFVSGGYLKLDLNCQTELPAAEATFSSGTVSINQLQAQKDGVVSGTFDISIGEQADPAKGFFSATYCDVDPAQLNCQ